MKRKRGERERESRKVEGKRREEGPVRYGGCGEGKGRRKLEI
jgi:hypothetical protein